MKNIVKTFYEIRFHQIGDKSKGGDSILIRFGKIDGENNLLEQLVILIDAGYAKDTYKVLNTLKEWGASHINLVVNTHPDSDHINGIEELIVNHTEITIGTILMHTPWSNKNINTSYFKDGRMTEHSLDEKLKAAFQSALNIESAAKQRKIDLEQPFAGDYYEYGEETVFSILGPTEDFYIDKLVASEKTPEEKEKNSKMQSFANAGDSGYDWENYDPEEDLEYIDDGETSEINDTSVICMFEYAGCKFLFTGDAGRDALYDVLKRHPEITGCKLQIPHHGSRKNIDWDLIDEINPSKVYISIPKEGDPKHPSRRLINYLVDKKGIDVFCTRGGWLSHHHNIKINAKTAKSETVFMEIDGKKK